MENSKIVRLLNALDKLERNEFGRYIQTDFFNRKERLIKLAGYLLDSVKGKRAFATKEVLYHNLFQDEAATFAKLEKEGKDRHLKKRMDQLTYELKTHLEDYLIWKQGRETSFYRDLSLLKAYEKRDAEPFFRTQYKGMVKGLKDPNCINTANHQHLYTIHEMATEHPNSQDWKEEDTALGDMQEELNTYYLKLRLRNTWLQLINGFYNNWPYDQEIIQEILAFAEKELPKGHLFIVVYHKAIQDFLKKEFTWEGINFLRECILPSLERHSREDQLKLYMLLLNYAVLMNQFSSKSKPGDHFDLYLLGLKHGFLLRHGQFGYVDFHNCVLGAVDAGKLEWAEDFVKSYGKYLDESIREPTVLFELAMIKQRQGEYRQALDILAGKQVYTSELDKIQVLVLRVKCIYGLDDLELLENTLEASRKLIARNPTLGEGFREIMGNFIRLTSRLYRARHSPERSVLAQALYQELLEGHRYAAKRWLLEETKKLIS